MPAAEVDIDELATPVDYFFGTRKIGEEWSPVWVPGTKVMPTGSLQNTVALAKNNAALTVPEGQVRAGYIDAQPGGNIMRYADASHRAMFLMLGDYTSGTMLIQSTGFLTIPNGHQYITSEQYYVGENGEPVTDSASGQKLFIPLSDTILMINGDF